MMLTLRWYHHMILSAVTRGLDPLPPLTTVNFEEKPMAIFVLSTPLRAYEVLHAHLCLLARVSPQRDLARVSLVAAYAERAGPSLT
jgi:hypothetical protein